jgi:hypothetical protein
MCATRKVPVVRDSRNGRALSAHGSAVTRGRIVAVLGRRTAEAAMPDERTPIDPDTPIPDTQPEPQDRVEVGDINERPTDEDGRPIQPQDAPRRGDPRAGRLDGSPRRPLAQGGMALFGIRGAHPPMPAVSTGLEG